MGGWVPIFWGVRPKMKRVTRRTDITTTVKKRNKRWEKSTFRNIIFLYICVGRGESIKVNFLGRIFFSIFEKQYTFLRKTCKYAYKLGQNLNVVKFLEKLQLLNVPQTRKNRDYVSLRISSKKAKTFVLDILGQNE